MLVVAGQAMEALKEVRASLASDELCSGAYVVLRRCSRRRRTRHERVTPESLLKQAVHAQRMGNFEASWQSLMAFFAHPGSNDVDIGAFGEYFFPPRISAVWRLGSFLGKSKAAAGDLESFCPHWNKQRAQVRAEMAGESPEAVDTMLQEFDFIRSRAFQGPVLNGAGAN